MGWGHKFPVLRQLRQILPQNPAQRRDSRDFFIHQYGADGAGYNLGALCRDWAPDLQPNPPWQNENPNDENDHPHYGPDADDWFRHCDDDLNGTNFGTDEFPDGNGPASVHDDLQRWVLDAMLDRLGTPPGSGNAPSNEAQPVKYLWKRQRGPSTSWSAERTWQGSHWQITVFGPGW